MTNAPAGNVIWQYWETRGEKPRYIDGLHEIAKRNSGVEVILVTPQTLADYLPDLEPEILGVAELAHKADMIRTRLVMRHGGMWLDSDAVVLSDLNWLFDLLAEHEFVGFNNQGRMQEARPWVRVNCFLSRPDGQVVSEWVAGQRQKLTQATFGWSEIGAAMLNLICLAHPDLVNILPLEKICPIPHKKVADFLLKDDALAGRILDECFMVMLSNRSIEIRQIPLQHLTVEKIAAGDYVLSRILRQALACFSEVSQAAQKSV
jgi:hypothetical protein